MWAGWDEIVDGGYGQECITACGVITKPNLINIGDLIDLMLEGAARKGKL
jgi:hypothetical protein